MTTKHVFRQINLPEPPSDPKAISDYIRDSLIPALLVAAKEHLHTFPAVISGELRGKTYTEATKPTAVEAGTAAIILSTDAATKPQMSDGSVWIPLGAGAGGGDNVTINGAAVVDADFDDATPAAPAASVNVKWQKDASSPANISAYVPEGGLWHEFTQDLGAAKSSGTFDITGLTGLTSDKVVHIVQTASPIASKGNARDEAEFDMIELTGYVFNSSTIRAYWRAPGVVVGTYAFAYQVGA